MTAPDGTDVPDSVAAAQAEIERTREQLQDTVDQLSDRLDPRVRAKEAGESVKQTAADGVAKGRHAATKSVDAAKQNPPVVAGIAAAVVAVVVAVVIWQRRR